MTEQTKSKKLKSPYIAKSWMHNFLELIRRVRLEKFNSGTVKQYQLTAAGNESKLVGAVKFLNIARPDGTINQDLIKQLKMDGDAFKKALSGIVKTAYSDLFNTIDVKQAKASDLKNYFIGKDNFSMLQANGAATLFAFLCGKADIEVSTEISDLNKQKIRKKQSSKSVAKQKKPLKQKPTQTPEEKHIVDKIPEDEGEYQIRISGKNLSLTKKISSEKDLKDFIDALRVLCTFKNS